MATTSADVAEAAEIAPERVVLRVTNEDPDVQKCRPAYTTFDAFRPDWPGLREAGLFEDFVSEADFGYVLDSVNEIVEAHRNVQKASSLIAAFGTLLAIILAVFVIYAGVALQVVLLAVHFGLSSHLRSRCIGRVNALLAADVNPAIAARGVLLVLYCASEACFASPLLSLELRKLGTFDAVRREVRLARAAEQMRAGASLSREGSAVPEGSPSAGRGRRALSASSAGTGTGLDDDIFSGVVVGSVQHPEEHDDATAHPHAIAGVVVDETRSFEAGRRSRSPAKRGHR